MGELDAAGWADPIIRPATPVDLPAILALWARLQQVVTNAEPSLATSSAGRAWYENYLLGQMNDGSASLLVVSRGSIRVGYTFAQIHQRPTLVARRCGFIAEVVVQEEHRRQGLGRLMVDTQVAWLRKQGVDRVEVQVLDENPEASAFWQAMGFGGHLRTLGRTLH